MKFARLLRDVWVGGVHGCWLKQGEVVQLSSGPDALGDVQTWRGHWLAAGDYEECERPPAEPWRRDW